MRPVQYLSSSHLSACCGAPVIGIIFATDETVWKWKMVHVCVACRESCGITDKKPEAKP